MRALFLSLFFIANCFALSAKADSTPVADECDENRAAVAACADKFIQVHKFVADDVASADATGEGTVMSRNQGYRYMVWKCLTPENVTCSADKSLTPTEVKEIITARLQAHFGL